MYSRINTSSVPMVDPDTGNPIVPGAGYLQQIEFGGNTERFTTLSTELLEAFIQKITLNRINPGVAIDLVAFTGTAGLKRKRIKRC